MRLSLNKFIRLNIHGKLTIAFAGLSILPLVIVGYLGISSNVSSLRQMAVENLNHDLLAIKARVAAFFQNMEDNVETLVFSSSFQHFVQAVETSDKNSISLTKKQLLPEIINLARRKGFFYQIKFIDRQGNEAFTIEKSRETYRILSPDELNRSGTQFYLYLARQIPANKAIFLPVELRLKNGREHLPAISCIYSIYRENFVGLLIFHIPAQNFFKILEQQAPLSPVGKIMLVNADGYYLYHSEKKKNWDQLLASKETENLKVDYGDRIAKALLSARAKPVQEINDELVAHAPIFNQYSGFENEYTILKSVAKSEVYAPVAAYKKLFWGILAGFLFASLLLAYFATRQLTGTIQKLRQEAELIAQGDYRSRIDVHTYDEIGDLARHFNKMAGALEQREDEIAQHRERLEQMVQERTRELKREKNKLQAILDNVPSGFLLLDRDYKIISASAALQKIAGKPIQELLGEPCYNVVGNGNICASCPTVEVFQSGRSHSRLLTRLNSEGEECFFEHVSVPLKKGRHVEYVLEIITDVTGRKRLQDQLIRSERLATTGEIAAFVAHEMRNSLTSIRMLLQLLIEAEYLNRSDRESLGVALNSLSRIERVVNDLLQLARPARLHKKPEVLNDILQESMNFAKHHVVKKGIRVEMDLAPDLPRLLLDRDQIKEAFVNLILNAAQAIHREGSISIFSRFTKLDKSLRDLGEVGVASAENQAVGVQEIVLKKGTSALVVEIADTGAGIADENLARIFDPFFTTKVNGTGLGLSFVKRVVNEHGGIVSVKSKLRKGSVFMLIFPLYDEKKGSDGAFAA